MGVEEAETREAEPEAGVATREDPEEEDEGENELVEVQQRPVPAKSGAKEPAERTDDPVRMYLREMGSVELLSREGEIAIAKRIEAGRDSARARSPSRPLSSGGTSSTRARSSCATSSTSKQPMPALTPRPRRRR